MHGRITAALSGVLEEMCVGIMTCLETLPLFRPAFSLQTNGGHVTVRIVILRDRLAISCVDVVRLFWCRGKPGFECDGAAR